MIKVENGIATRQPVPKFLHGLALESLADLSWTDPALGVSNAAWWPGVDQSPQLEEGEVYDGETLTPDGENKQVIIVRMVRPMTVEELEAIEAAKRYQSVTPLGLLDLVTVYGGMTDELFAQAWADAQLAPFIGMLPLTQSIKRTDPRTVQGLTLLNALGYLPNGVPAVMDAWPVE